MKKCILFVFLFMLFLLIGPEPKEVGIQRRSNHLTITTKEDAPELIRIAIKHFERQVRLKVSSAFVENICERKRPATQVNFKCVVVKPKYRPQSARRNITEAQYFYLKNANICSILRTWDFA